MDNELPLVKCATLPVQYGPSHHSHGSKMAYRIKPEEFEQYYLADNCVGVVNVTAGNLERVAKLLSERFPGIIFLWWSPSSNGEYDISAVRPDRRAISRADEEKIVAAGETIARNVEIKHPARRGILAWLFRPKVKPGWHFTEKPTKPSKRR